MKKGRVGAAFPGRNPAAPVAGSEGEVGEELEDIDGYPKVVLDGVGGDWTELAAVAVGPAGEVQWTTRKLSWGSIWVEEGRSRGSTVSSSGGQQWRGDGAVGVRRVLGAAMEGRRPFYR